MSRKILDAHKELQFRVSLVRSGLGVDTIPNDTNVEQFAFHLLAEFEQLAISEKRSSTSTTKNDPTKVKPAENEKLKAAKVKKLEEGGGSPKKEESREEKGKCKFYLSEQGCRRGKMCSWSHDQKDERRRCYVCGSPEHMASSCTRPKGPNDASPTRPKIQKVEGEEKSPSSSRSKEDEGSQEQSSMKDLLEQANKMLKSLTTASSTASTAPGTSGEPRDEVVDRLQQQLNSLKLKVFKLSQVSYGNSQGLLDSGATHALRPIKKGESLDGYRTVPVTLANGQSTQLHMTEGGVMVSKRADIEPILPMGLLIEKLGCKMVWGDDGALLQHPQRGSLPIKVNGGCPQISRSLALELIEELENVVVLGKIQERTFKEEYEWMKQLVETHPILRQLPHHIKSKLAVEPGLWSNLPANRRTRKRFQRDGLMVHLYSGPDQGYTLGRAWRQRGGDNMSLLEIDLLRGSQHDMLQEDGPYQGLVRAALENKLHAIVGGPNCRSRSVLRHFPIPDQPNCPRPLRAWGEGEYGISGLTPDEIAILHDDDVLLWRMIFLAMISNYIKDARRDSKPVVFALEQPASPKNYMPETVSFWDTMEWAELKKEFGWEETTFQQGSMGGAAIKPTTFGGNLELDVNKHKRVRNGQEQVEVKSSKELSRWAPGVMAMVAEALMVQVKHQLPRL
eukprot:s3759_g6.t1